MTLTPTSPSTAACMLRNGPSKEQLSKYEQNLGFNEPFTVELVDHDGESLGEHQVVPRSVKHLTTSDHEFDVVGDVTTSIWIIALKGYDTRTREGQVELLM